MAGAEETLVLTDASVEDQVRTALIASGIPEGRLVVEPADNWPGQELAVDLYAADEADLAGLIAKSQVILRRDLGITDAPTSAEYSNRDHTATT